MSGEAVFSTCAATKNVLVTGDSAGQLSQLVNVLVTILSLDIDECAANTNVCQQRCVNVDGTYNCDCNYGYRLNSDRTTCSQSE